MSTQIVYPTEVGGFGLWVATVKRIVGGPTEGLSLLDLCCNECTVTSLLPWEHHVGVDVVDWPTRKPISNFTRQDVLDYLHTELASPDRPMDGKWHDVCICSDGIEHLTKAQGLTLLKEMERVAKLSIIFTPLGDYMVEPDSTHPDKHRSGWVPGELAELGWSSISFPSWHKAIGAGAFFAYKDLR